MNTIFTTVPIELLDFFCDRISENQLIAKEWYELNQETQNQIVLNVIQGYVATTIDRLINSEIIPEPFNNSEFWRISVCEQLNELEYIETRYRHYISLENMLKSDTNRFLPF